MFTWITIIMVMICIPPVRVKEQPIGDGQNGKLIVRQKDIYTMKVLHDSIAITPKHFIWAGMLV